MSIVDVIPISPPRASSCCFAHNHKSGRNTDWVTDRSKEFSLKAKVTDKNIQMLEGNKTVDGQLGMATPSMIQSAEEIAKSEVPSLEKLKDSHKTAKTA